MRIRSVMLPAQIHGTDVCMEAWHRAWAMEQRLAPLYDKSYA